MGQEHSKHIFLVCLGHVGLATALGLPAILGPMARLTTVEAGIVPGCPMFPDGTAIYTSMRMVGLLLLTGSVLVTVGRA